MSLTLWSEYEEVRRAQPGARHASRRRAPLLDCDLLGNQRRASFAWFSAAQFRFDRK
jgi:hypothetical protein